MAWGKSCKPAPQYNAKGEEQETFDLIRYRADLQLEEERIVTERKVKAEGIYPKRLRLIVVSGNNKDGLLPTPIRYFCPFDAGPQPEFQLHRAPESGYQREWVLTADELSLVSGQDHPVFSFIRLNGKYGRMRIHEVDQLYKKIAHTGRRVDHEVRVPTSEELIKERWLGDSGWWWRRLSGVYPTQDVFSLNVGFRMQDLGGTNLLTSGVDAFYDQFMVPQRHERNDPGKGH